MPRKSIADQFRRSIRSAKRQGISRYRISEVTGVAQSTLTQFMQGKTPLTTDQAERVAAAIGMRLLLTSTDK